MTLPDFLAHEQEGFIHFSGHRIGLHHLLRFYNEGFSPEMLIEQFPTLSLALIHKAIGFYLENQYECDSYLAEQDAALEEQLKQNPRGADLSELRRRSKSIRVKA